MDIPKETQYESYSQISLVAEIRKKLILGLLKERGDSTAQELATELHKRGHILNSQHFFDKIRSNDIKF